MQVFVTFTAIIILVFPSLFSRKKKEQEEIALTGRPFPRPPPASPAEHINNLGAGTVPKCIQRAAGSE